MNARERFEKLLNTYGSAAYGLEEGFSTQAEERAAYAALLAWADDAIVRLARPPVASWEAPMTNAEAAGVIRANVFAANVECIPDSELPESKRVEVRQFREALTLAIAALEGPGREACPCCGFSLREGNDFGHGDTFFCATCHAFRCGEQVIAIPENRAGECSVCGAKTRLIGVGPFDGEADAMLALRGRT